MVLLVRADEIEGLLTMGDAMAVVETIAREEVAGTTVHMAAFGGQNARPRGLPPALGRGSGGGSSGVLRVVGGGAYGLGRVGVRAGGVVLLFTTEGNRLLAILGSSASSLRIGATMGVAARRLARPEARSIGLLGSGRNALPTLEGLVAVRAIERVSVYSPTPEHRTAFAKRATEALGVPVTAVDSVEAATADADIIALATVATTPALKAEHVRPGVHVTSMGEPHEIDESVFLKADQIVASGWTQELEAINPSGQRIRQRQGLAAPPLWELLADGRIKKENLVELGSIVSGDVPARNGPADITIFREAQGGAGDIALANFVYGRAQALGRGTEIQI
jgi:ornithine cyclodeaminase/alanine dehydrogenase-like protein (mu-crystallin family)